MLNNPAELLDHLPQQRPFRFVDKVLEADERHIVCEYTFRPEEDFYRGHFPGQPLTPGVILLEAMAQAGVVLQGLYLLMREGVSTREYRTMFTDAEVEAADCVVMLTPHRAFLEQPRWDKARLVVDTRNVVPRAPHVFSI